MCMQPRASDVRRASFEKVAREEGPGLFALARRLAGDSHDAADLVQDAFERALRSPRSLGPHELRPWMITVIRNLFVDRCRSRRFRSRALRGFRPDPEATPPQPQERASSRFTGEDVTRALAGLDRTFRDVFELYARSKSLRDVATALDIPVSTAGTRLFRARRKLRTALLVAAAECPDEP
jgi:RNA polymerase sigma-70 factor (ECF subfamily)